MTVAATWGQEAFKMPERQGTANNDIMPVSDYSGLERLKKTAAPIYLTDHRAWQLDYRGLRFWGDWPPQRGRVFIDDPEGGKVLIDWRKAKKLKRKGLT